MCLEEFCYIFAYDIGLESGIGVSCFLAPCGAIDAVFVVIVEFLGERKVGKLVCGCRYAVVFCAGSIQVEYVVN